MTPNAIVICFDTLRRDAVSTDLAATPHLDHFAEQAVVFENAWAEGLPTIPFRRAAFTGMRSYPWNHNIGDRGSQPNLLGWHAIPESQTTIAEYLYRRGYVTGLVTDLWHMFKPSMNFHRGFVSWEFIRGQEGDTHELGSTSFVDPSPHAGRRIAPSSYLYQVRNRQSDRDYFAAQVFERAAEWVEGNRKNQPYFLWVDSFSPHEFWDPPTRFADAYASGEGLLDHIVPQTLNGTNPTEQDILRTQALYKGYVTFCDEQLGRFLERVQRSGALADTVIVILSDHGTELWDQERFGKAASRPHRYNTQINWLVTHPDLSRHHSVTDFVQNHDIVPTLLGLLGVGHPPLDGRNVWPMDQAVQPRDHVITGWETWVSVRDSRWNLILDTVNLRDVRLYDLLADPQEKENVAAHHPDIVRHAAERVEALLGGPLPANYLHRPRNFSATVGGLRQVRKQAQHLGERWQGSNLV